MGQLRATDENWTKALRDGGLGGGVPAKFTAKIRIIAEMVPAQLKSAEIDRSLTRQALTVYLRESSRRVSSVERKRVGDVVSGTNGTRMYSGRTRSWPEDPNRPAEQRTIGKGGLQCIAHHMAVALNLDQESMQKEIVGARSE